MMSSRKPKTSFSLSRTVFVLIAGLLALNITVRAEEINLSSWKSITVGVADLDAALTLWVDDFGMEIISRQNGPDADLASLWDISGDDIVSQALVQMPGSELGMIHFVEFLDPAPPVREGAEVFDWVPKNLDVYVDDLPRRFAELKESGRTFRSENYSEVTAPNGISFREIHMPSHDNVNVVLLEVIGTEMPFSPAGYSAVGPLITIVPDAAKEREFFQDVVGLKILSDNVLKGPEIEKMIGLPPGAALNVSIWGEKEYELGQIEIIEYGGVTGRNLYPRARPKSLGILHVAYEATDLAIVKRHLAEHDVPYATYDSVSTLLGSGSAVSFHSPAGLRIEVHERK